MKQKIWYIIFISSIFVTVISGCKQQTTEDSNISEHEKFQDKQTSDYAAQDSWKEKSGHMQSPVNITKSKIQPMNDN